MKEINIKEVIIKAIDESGMKRREIAEQLRISQQALSNVLTKPDRRVSTTMIIKLINVLNNPDYERIAVTYISNLNLLYQKRSVLKHATLDRVYVQREEMEANQKFDAVAEILNKAPETCSDSELEQIRSLKKEWGEQIGAEMSVYCDLIDYINTAQNHYVYEEV